MQIHDDTWPHEAQEKQRRGCQSGKLWEAVHILSRKFQGTKKHEGWFFFQVINPCSTEAANRFLQGSSTASRVCPRDVRHDPQRQRGLFGSHCRREEDGDGEIGKRVKHVLRGLTVGSLPRAIISVLQRKERQARSGSGVRWVHRKEILGLQRCSITSTSATDPALPSRNP